jgi:capsular polysaccharide transport system ATP-binding protein
MIELQNVSKFFTTKQGKHYILKNVTFTIPSGKNIGILGRNGAGKSTIMKMLGQIEFPNEGRIISDKSFSWVMGVAGGFQGNMTGRANVKFVCRIYGRSKQEIEESINFVKEFSELDDYFEMPIKTYSSGMRSRLTFGLSLAFDFDYLLIDETLSVGDARFKKKSKEALMRKIERCNVLLVSHEMATLKEICDSGIVVDNGKMSYYEDIEDAIKEYAEINKRAK